jgi:hypothetical protein
MRVWCRTSSATNPLSHSRQTLAPRSARPSPARSSSRTSPRGNTAYVTAMVVLAVLAFIGLAAANRLPTHAQQDRGAVQAAWGVGDAAYASAEALNTGTRRRLTTSAFAPRLLPRCRVAGDAQRSRSSGACHVHGAARCRRPSSIAGDDVGFPLRPTAAQQGPPLSRRSSDRRGDRRRHATGRHDAARLADAQLESRAVAAGWGPAPAGKAWYAKRFVWQPPRASRPVAERSRRAADQTR